MSDIVKKYSNGEINVIWKPGICIHSTKCWKELSEVFQPKNRPWINPAGASSEAIIRQIENCPSKALAWEKIEIKDEKS